MVMGMDRRTGKEPRKEAIKKPWSVLSHEVRTSAFSDSSHKLISQ
jgi:hypothetical protein